MNPYAYLIDHKHFNYADGQVGTPFLLKNICNEKELLLYKTLNTLTPLRTSTCQSTYLIFALSSKIKHVLFTVYKSWTITKYE